MKLMIWLFLLLFLVPLVGCQKTISHPLESQPTTVGTDIPKGDLEIQEVEEVGTGKTDVPDKVQPEAQQAVLVNIDFEDLKKMSFEHEVQAGESLSEVAAKYDVGIGLLIRLNHIQDPNQVRSGQGLKVIQGPFRIVIHKKEKTLSVFLKDQHLKTYDVAVGKSDSTPEGSFTIMDKIIKPVWTDPYLRIQIKPEDPRYPLGTRWLQFAQYGYGIHGTNDPESIKTEASFGCIRMLNPDVEELYDWVSIGSEVLVVP